MCRDNRRCPSYSDRSLIEARNARRRAAYASQVIATTQPKGKKLKKLEESVKLNLRKSDELKIEAEEKHLKFMENNKLSEVDEKLLEDSSKEKRVRVEMDPHERALREKMARYENTEPIFDEFGHPVLFNGAEYDGYSKDELLKVSEQVVSSHELNNIYSTSNKGKLAGLYFSGETIHGVVDYSKLDKSSAVEVFGFNEIVEGEPYDLKDFVETENLDQFLRFSEMETHHLSRDSKEAITYFTDEGYRWLNKSIYEGIQELPEGNNVDLSLNTTEIIRKTKYSSENENFFENKNAYVAKKIVEELDEALDKGPKVQRKVYRAIQGHVRFDGMKPKDWVDENIEIGKEIVVDGYQSTSPKINGIDYWLKDDTVLYEISTPEGLNVSKLSHHGYEQEILLPRDSRYVVVGVDKNVDLGRSTIFTKPPAKNMTIVRLVAINSNGEILDGNNSDPKKPIWDEIDLNNPPKSNEGTAESNNNEFFGENSKISETSTKIDETVSGFEKMDGDSSFVDPWNMMESKSKVKKSEPVFNDPWS